MPPSSPLDDYRSRLEARRLAHARLTATDERLGYARLATFAAAAAGAWLVFGPGTLAWWWLTLPAAAFAWLMARHDRVITARDRASRAIAFYERGLARIEDRWIGTGETGDRFRDDEHLYANDLDLFGPGSLFELLSSARTRSGEETLAAWLKRPAAPEVVRARHAAVDELARCVDLREHTALAGTDIRAAVDGEALIAWAERPPRLPGTVLRTAAAVLSLAAAGTAAWWAFTGSAEPFLAVVALEVLFWLPLRARAAGVLHAAGGPARDLDVLAHLLALVEREAFTAEPLAALRQSLASEGVPASAAICRLHRLSELHDWQHNQFFAPVAAALLWGTHLAFAIERWRARHGRHVAGWLRAVGEFEALGSLAAYRYEHPSDPFPEIVPGPPAFAGDGLAHPLIPASRAVPNDVRLEGDARLLVVSGSNMSGKSTLLRTVGVNVVLALAGAPVRAARLRVSPLTVGATLRIQDSLQEGRSRFYAEITRLRRISDAADGQPPLLFLLDELFHGTNSHDRLVGATGLLRSLLERGAAGLVTTHDLALTAVAADLAPRAVNVHFEDRFEGGEIRFDYRMRPGPVTRSNALALMRAVGLRLDA